jgi:murein L,D-transpeptidase YafK
MIAKFARAGLILAALALAGCTDATLSDVSWKSEKPLPAKFIKQMKAKGMTRHSPIMARIFKEEGKLEIWKRTNTGRYDLIANYDICKWSGKLGPKYTEGDRQAPEGFYTVRPTQMNPYSKHHLSFNIGFPNAYDRAHGRTGSNLMVHGACSSSGCYSMTDQQVEEIYAFARDAFRGGQTEFQIEAFPFRMTAQNMARYRSDPNYGFWKMLKEGYDHFEIAKVPPKVDVCEGRYVFNQTSANGATFNPTSACPPSTQPESLRLAYQTYQAKYETAFQSAIGSKTSAPKPTIGGTQEAALVSEWTKRRARGERIPIDPPSLNADGTVTVTSRMGRIDSPAGRRMAALEATEAKKKAEEEKKAEAAIARATASTPATVAAVPTPVPVTRATATGTAAKQETAPAAATVPPATALASPETADAGNSGLLGGVRKRFANLFGG